MQWLPFLCPIVPAAALAASLAACAGSPQLAYESAPPGEMTESNAVDSAEARALEQAEADCARQGKHAVSQRTEGETLYDCAD
jgi:hypothetical protein